MNAKQNNKILILTIAGLLDIMGMLFIILPVFELSPITLIISTVFGGGLVILSIIAYATVVTRDLIKKGIL